MTLKTIAALTAALSIGAVQAADDEDSAAETATEKAKETTEVVDTKAKLPEQALYALPMCRRARGQAEVRRLGSTEWVSIEEGKHYPLGSAFRAGNGGTVVVAFGPESYATVSNGASFVTRAQPLDEKSRTIMLDEGAVSLSFPQAMTPGKFFVVTSGFTVRNLVGDSRFCKCSKGDGEDIVVRCVTGALALGGRHFEIADMGAADEVRIRTTHDHLETLLYGTSGDYIVKVDRGIVSKPSVKEDGTVENVTEKSTLDWNLSPKTKIRIDRRVPAIGERMSVSVMAFDAAGDLKSHFAFSEGRAEVNSGELVKVSKEDGEALAKRAAEATEEKPAEEEKSEKASSDVGEKENDKSESDE